MGTHKICVAVNNGAPHQNARCDRTWAAVWRFLPAVREAPTHADRAELRAVSEGGRKEQEKAPALFCTGASTSARSAGSFQGQPLALFWKAENSVDAVFKQTGKKNRCLQLSPDAKLKNGGFLNLKDEKGRHTVWLTPAAWDMVEEHYRGDNCAVKNEYIEKAIAEQKELAPAPHLKKWAEHVSMIAAAISFPCGEPLQGERSEDRGS